MENEQSSEKIPEQKKEEKGSRIEKYDPLPWGFHRNRNGCAVPDYEKGSLRYRGDPDTRPLRYRS